MNDKVLAVISEALPGYSKGQKLIANYILEHCDKAAFMTAARLGGTVGVSESTVVRFAAEMGFEGYPGLQKSLQEVIRSRLTAVQRMEVAQERFGNEDVLQKVLQTDIDSIRRTLDKIDRRDFDASVEALISARKIYVIGVRSAQSLANFMGFYFRHIFADAVSVDATSTSLIFEQILRIGPGDVFIGITFSRYSSRTYKSAVFAKQNGATVIAVTDSLSAPICRVADHVLVAASEMSSFVDSLVAPLSVINALIVAIGLKKREEISAIYTRLEHIWDEYEVYQKDDSGAWEK